MAVSRTDIEAILTAFEASDWRSITLKADGVEVSLSKDGSLPHSPSVAVAAAAAPPATEPLAQPDGEAVVAAPSLGTFYLAPKPGAAPFTAVGERVTIGDDLCLIEVMKLFTSVKAHCAGVVTAILARDGDLVEHNQPLLRIKLDV
jgi:acetyl-CoA carboxylase biotin carboxyl carrier protein